jgi:hypothetical protein
MVMSKAFKKSNARRQVISFETLSNIPINGNTTTICDVHRCDDAEFSANTFSGNLTLEKVVYCRSGYGCFGASNIVQTTVACSLNDNSS